MNRRARQLALGIGGIVAGILFILAGFYMYYLLETHPTMGKYSKFWFPKLAPIFIVMGIIIVIFTILGTLAVLFAPTP